MERAGSQPFENRLESVPGREPRGAKPERLTCTPMPHSQLGWGGSRQAAAGPQTLRCLAAGFIPGVLIH